MNIQENLNKVEKNIQAACELANRSRQEITLIAVSKTKPVTMIQELLPAGITNFGENKPQELKSKYEVLPKSVNWHMIGHLQRNKVKYIVDKVCLIHSVDSLRLAETIHNEARKKDLTVPILIEVNVAEEESKFGIKPGDAADFVEEVSKFTGISIQGLMTIAPYVENPEKNRWIFRKLKNLSVDIKQKSINNVTMSVLSMGMTGDYEVAIEEGATMVRVGTGIFGQRNNKIGE